MTWEMVPLKHIGTWYGGGTPSKSNPDFWHDGTVPWLSPKDMGDDVLSGTKDHITEAAVTGSSVRRVPANSVAMVVRSGILEHTFPVTVVPFETTLNQDMKAIVASPGVDPRWLAWGLKAFERTILRTCRKAGTTVASIDTKRLQGFQFPVPSLGVQRQILASITDLFRRMKIIQDAHVSTARKLKSMILKSASDEVEGALDRHAPRSLGEHSLIVQYGTSAKTLADGYADGVPVVRMGNIQSGKLQLGSLKFLPRDHPDFPKLLLQDGDLLFNRTNSPELVGKSAVFRGDTQMSFASYLIRVQFDESVLPEWANLVINSPYGRRYIESVTTQQVGQANVNGKKLNAFPLPVPPLEQQRAAIERHGRVVEAATLLSQQMTVLQQRTEALRRSILTAAFEGRLTSADDYLSFSEEKVGVLV